MINRKKIESILTGSGFLDYCWINPRRIIVSQWVRVKCVFGCSGYGSGTCPPNTPTVEECRRFFSEYNNGLIVHLTKLAEKDSYPSDWSGQMTDRLLEIEKQVFLQGNYKAFLLNQACCSVCEDCSGNRTDCKDKSRARPSPEGFAVDVYQTVRRAGMKINVISESPSEMNRIAILLVN